MAPFGPPNAESAVRYTFRERLGALHELRKHKERQMEGIAGAKANKVYAGKGSPAFDRRGHHARDEGARSNIAVTNRTYRFSRDSSHSPKIFSPGKL